ncbi:PE domain-containing protein, partial [Mycobacterium tuberculosis]|uniref:PE domain-containing protein n=7 Tax=Mycobacterium tuberculosis TaxID=1773 RepID=UPI0025436978
MLPLEMGCFLQPIFTGDRGGPGRRDRAVMPVGRCQMSFVIAAPEVIAAAATDLASLESSIAAANAAAAANTTALLAAGADE